MYKMTCDSKINLFRFEGNYHVIMITLIDYSYLIQSNLQKCTLGNIEKWSHKTGGL